MSRDRLAASGADRAHARAIRRPTRTPTQRCFIALPLPEPVRAACAAIMTALQRDAPPLRWSRPDAVHLTLKFLGDVPREDLAALGEGLCAAVAPHAAFTLRTGELGTFGRSRRPRVLWLGVEGDLEALAAVHASVEAACATLGVARDRRPFQPHLTLARAQRPPAQASESWPAGEALPLPVVWDADAVHLYASHLQPGGAEHEILAICSLVTN